MKCILVFVLAFFSLGVFAGNYRVNEKQVSAMIENAKEINFSIPEGTQTNSTCSLPVYEAKYKDPVIAFLLCWFGGFLGFHRLYLGTASETFIAYVVTCGGCGIVATIDWVILLIEGIFNDNIDPYVDNPKFFMW